VSYPPQGGGAPPKNNMAISIVSLVIGLSGCVLFAIPGIMAVVQAGKVNGLAQSGQHGAAVEAAAKARRYAIIGLVISGIAIVLGIILFVVVVALGDDNSTTNALAAF
jgi:hypothetical protein